MKTLTVILVELDGTNDILGVFPRAQDALEHIWQKQIGSKLFAYPPGQDPDVHGKDIVFVVNRARLELRPAVPPTLEGLGPIQTGRAWVVQDGYESDLGWFVVDYSAADNNINYSRESDLRFAVMEGVFTVASITSALGQSIEEARATARAKSVQAQMLAGYSLADGIATKSLYDSFGKELPPKPPIDDYICEGCAVAAVPGAIFPMASNEMTDHPYIEVCDVCRIFELDVQAAKAVSVVFGKPLKLSEDGRPYLDGLTFEEAKVLATSMQRPEQNVGDLS